ncbi:MAG: hypothetical protein LBL52_00645 [Rickettsiales bacterium]|jgi:hypothetical protein|nr:hypothetical protein [Rickettsiales bacterium]
MRLTLAEAQEAIGTPDKTRWQKIVQYNNIQVAYSSTLQPGVYRVDLKYGSCASNSRVTIVGSPSTLSIPVPRAGDCAYSCHATIDGVSATDGVACADSSSYQTISTPGITQTDIANYNGITVYKLD